MTLDKREELSKLIGRQMMMMVASYAKISDSSISASQYFILQTLAYEGELTSSYFAHTLDITQPAVTNLSTKLIQKGYVERIPSTTDKRQVYLRITESGRRMERQMQEKYQQLTASLWEDFSEQEVDLLIAAYGKMIKHLQDQMKKKPE